MGFVFPNYFENYCGFSLSNYIEFAKEITTLKMETRSTFTDLKFDDRHHKPSMIKYICGRVGGSEAP